MALSRLRPVVPVTRRLLRMRRTHRMRQAHLGPRATPGSGRAGTGCARSPDSPGTGRVDVFSATAGADAADAADAARPAAAAAAAEPVAAADPC